jgi:hypothetical protein
VVVEVREFLVHNGHSVQAVLVVHYLNEWVLVGLELRTGVIEFHCLVVEALHEAPNRLVHDGPHQMQVGSVLKLGYCCQLFYGEQSWLNHRLLGLLLGHALGNFLLGERCKHSV